MALSVQACFCITADHDVMFAVLTQGDRILVGVYNYVQGDTTREFVKRDADLAIPDLSGGGRTPLRRLVQSGLLLHIGEQQSGRYMLSEGGAKRARELLGL